MVKVNKLKVNKIILKYKKNKYGFTLIETMCTITILISIISFITVNIKGFVRITNQLDYKMCSNCIVDFINSSRYYCSYNKCFGKIDLDEEKDKMFFQCGGKKIKEYKLPNDFKLICYNARKLYINNKGFNQNACTIKYLDRIKNIHELTICVGTGHVQIKK